MSVQKKFENKLRTIVDKVLVSEKRYCDCCGEEITGPYWEVTLGDYVADDGIWDEKDICSPKCLNLTYVKYVDATKKIPGCSRFININHKFCSGVKGDIKDE